MRKRTDKHSSRCTRFLLIPARYVAMNAAFGSMDACEQTGVDTVKMELERIERMRPSCHLRCFYAGKRRTPTEVAGSTFLDAEPKQMRQKAEDSMAQTEQLKLQLERAHIVGAERIAKMRSDKAKALTFGQYRVFRLDEHNWVYQKIVDGIEGDYNFYPTFVDAMKGLLPALIGDAVSANRDKAEPVRGILAAIEKVRQEVADVLQEIDGKDTHE